MPIFRLCAPFWLFIHYANGMFFTVTVALPKDCVYIGVWYATLVFKKTIIVSVTVIAYSGTCIYMGETRFTPRLRRQSLLLAQTLMSNYCPTSRYSALTLEMKAWYSVISRRLSHHWHRLHKTCWLHRHRRPLSNVFSVSVATSLQEREIVSARK